MDYQLAQLNIGRILGPINGPVMAEFVANLDRINGIAEKSNGFIWRLKDETDNATSIKVYDDDFIIVNMSVWNDIDSLTHFVYKSDHLEILKRSKEWFSKLKDMHMALWYIPAGHIPTVEEATQRLDYLRQHKETPFSFSFRKKFSVAEFEQYNVVK